MVNNSGNNTNINKTKNYLLPQKGKRTLLYRYWWNTVISELNKNDNFTSEITIFISLSLYFAPFRCRRHMKISTKTTKITKEKKNEKKTKNKNKTN
jgi:hypothetical protein